MTFARTSSDTEFCKAAHKLQITPDFRVL